MEKSKWTDIEGFDSVQAAPTPYHKTAFKWIAAKARKEAPGNQNVRIKKLRDTAWLDGLRGFAALLVYILHHQVWAHSPYILENAWGYNNQYYVACLPIIRIFFTGGHYAVTVFFVISGYVLSAKPISYIQAENFEKLSENLGSALFRRWIRLYIPVICTTFIMACVPHIFNTRANFDPQLTWRDEIWKFYCEFKNFSFVWRMGGDPWFTYSFHVWSIPYEMRGSITIYTALIAFSRCTTTGRLLCEAGLAFYFLYIADGAHFAMFTTGMLLCDLDQLAMLQKLPSWISLLEPCKKPIFCSMFTLALLLGGCPSFDFNIQFLRDSPGWSHFVWLVPQAVFDYKWFFLFWAAVFTVASIPRIACLKSFFDGRFCQYLGRISFAFYLVHGPVLWILGERLYAATGWWKEWHLEQLPNWIDRFKLPHSGPLGLELSFLIPQLVLLPVTCWLAEILTTIFDEPSIKFAQWVYRQVTTKEEDKSAAAEK